MATVDFQVKNGVFANTYVIVGNSSINATMNSTFFTGTANNALNIGSLPASNVVSNTYLQSALNNINISGSTANNANHVYGKNEGDLNVNSAATALLANNANHVYGKNEGDLNVNSAATALLANNALYLGGIIAANYALLASPAFTGTVSLGANVVVNTSAFFVGNATVNAFLTSTGLSINGVAFSSGGGYYKGNAGTVGAPSNANNLFRINSNTMSNNITIAAGENALTVGPITIGTGNTFTISTGGRAVII